MLVMCTVYMHWFDTVNFVTEDLICAKYHKSMYNTSKCYSVNEVCLQKVTYELLDFFFWTKNQIAGKVLSSLDKKKMYWI